MPKIGEITFHRYILHLGKNTSPNETGPYTFWHPSYLNTWSIRGNMKYMTSKLVHSIGVKQQKLFSFAPYQNLSHQTHLTNIRNDGKVYPFNCAMKYQFFEIKFHLIFIWWVISSFQPVFLYVNRCVICQMEYKRRDRQITLPCKHAYHAGCGSRWLSINKVIK